MKAYHDIENLHFSGEYMILDIDGEERNLESRRYHLLLKRHQIVKGICMSSPLRVTAFTGL